MCNTKNDNSFLIGMVVGGALGAVFGYLTAPAPGEESRKKLAQTATKYYDEGRIQAQKAKASLEKIKDDAALTAERAEGIYSELSDEFKEVANEIKEKVGPLIQQAEEASLPLREEIKEKIGQLVEEVEEKVKEERKNAKKRMFSGVK